MADLKQLSAIKKISSARNGKRLLSFGVKSNVKDLVGEQNNPLEVGMVITNATSKDVTIAIGADNSQHDFGVLDSEDILTALGADTFLNDGVIYSHAGKDVTVESTNAKHTISQMIRYALLNPFRFTRFVMNSMTTGGAKEATNFTGKIKTMFLSPFEDTIEDEFSLRSIVKDKFQENLLEVNFVSQTGLNPIVSADNFVVFTVKSGTVLTINAGIGAQFSPNQYLFRRTSFADSIMKPLLRRIGL